MNAISCLRDGRIDANNYLVEISIGDYLKIARRILSKNDFQRGRIKSSPTLYSLLKDDVQRGCVLPPIVMAVDDNTGGTLPTLVDFHTFFESNSERMLILDGLQRTSSLIELFDELERKAQPDLVPTEANVKAREQLNALSARQLRLEVYVGINRLGILYRMLTLNTAQTPMSLRQQVEILFLDYKNVPLNNIRLLRELEDNTATNPGEYSFKAMIDGFTSYLERNELPIDRFDLLENIKSLKKLSQEDEKKNLFQDFVGSYNEFVEKVHTLSNGKSFTSTDLDIKGQPYARDARRIFSKEQALAGFGAAVGKLKDYNRIQSFDDVRESIENLKAAPTGEVAIESLLRQLEELRLHSKKIGNSQRLYFQFYFRELLNSESDAYRDLAAAVGTAYQKYESQTL